ncbi:MAG: hypothetical protein ACTSWW_13485 [Promethearchaeota archaeon]
MQIIYDYPLTDGVPVSYYPDRFLTAVGASGISGAGWLDVEADGHKITIPIQSGIPLLIFPWQFSPRIQRIKLTARGNIIARTMWKKESLAPVSASKVQMITTPIFSSTSSLRIRVGSSDPTILTSLIFRTPDQNTVLSLENVGKADNRNIIEVYGDVRLTDLQIPLSQRAEFCISNSLNPIDGILTYGVAQQEE